MNKEEIRLKLIEIYYKYYNITSIGYNVSNFVENIFKIVDDSNE